MQPQTTISYVNLLTPEEQALRHKVRACVEKEIAPFQIVLKLGAMNIAGGTIKVFYTYI